MKRKSFVQTSDKANSAGRQAAFLSSGPGDSFFSLRRQSFSPAEAHLNRFLQLNRGANASRVSPRVGFSRDPSRCLARYADSDGDFVWGEEGHRQYENPRL